MSGVSARLYDIYPEALRHNLYLLRVTVCGAVPLATYLQTGLKSSMSWGRVLDHCSWLTVSLLSTPEVIMIS